MSKVILAVLCAVGLALGLAGAAQAGTIIPNVTVTQTNTALNYGHGILAAIANGAGLTGTAPNQVHDTQWTTNMPNPGPATMWRYTSTSSDYKGYATWIFDLQSSQSVGLMEVWNYNRPGLGSEGIKTVNIYTSTSASGDSDWVSKGSQTFAKASGAVGDPGLDFTVSWSNVRRVKFVGTDHYSTSGWGPVEQRNPYSGLSEVQFWTPEPATLALLGLGGLGMLLSRKRK